MKITRYAMMLAAATGLLSACQKLDEVKAYDPDKVVAPVLHALPGEIVITPDNMGSTQTFTWDAADFGVRTQINYSIEASYNDGAKLVLFTGMDGTSSEQTYESLNNILALSVEDGGLGVPSGEPTDVDFYISATIGTDFEKFYSAPVTVRMTVTTAERTYPRIWVIGDYCGWNFDNAQGLFCFSGDEVTYEAIVDFGEKAANGFKLSGEAGWNDACNWGTDGDAAAPETEAPSITLISSGGSGNIMVYSKRFYRFVFDRSTLTLSNKLSFNSMGIIGDATPGGWDTDTEMNFDTKKQRFWVDVTLSAGEFKFRADNDWAINFGGADGRLSQNGDNIKATAGNYRVYATLNNSAEITYELNAGDYGAGGGEEPDPGPEKADWYIHGQTVATPRLGPDGHGERQLEHRGLQGRRNRGSRQLGIPLQERRRVAVDRGRRRIRRQQPLHLHDRLGLQGFRRQGQCRDRRSRHVRLLAAARGGTRLRDGRRRQARAGRRHMGTGRQHHRMG